MSPEHLDFPSVQGTSIMADTAWLALERSKWAYFSFVFWANIRAFCSVHQWCVSSFWVNKHILPRLASRLQDAFWQCLIDDTLSHIKLNRWDKLSSLFYKNFLLVNYPMLSSVVFAWYSCTGNVENRSEHALNQVGLGNSIGFDVVWAW